MHFSRLESSLGLQHTGGVGGCVCTCVCVLGRAGVCGRGGGGLGDIDTYTCADLKFTHSHLVSRHKQIQTCAHTHTHINRYSCSPCFTYTCRHSVDWCWCLKSFGNTARPAKTKSLNVKKHAFLMPSFGLNKWSIQFTVKSFRTVWWPLLKQTVKTKRCLI